jgi:hypothetical protein
MSTKKPGPKITFLYEPLTAEERRGYDEIRWKRDHVDKLREGFSLVSDGRSGYLYFREGDRFIEVYVELAGDPSFDLILEIRGLKSWISLATLSRDPVPPDEETRIRSEMEAWLRTRKIRYSAS